MTDRDPSGDATDLSGTALAQGDLAVNLFIVLLVILAILTLAEISSSSEGYLTPYRRSEPAATAGAPVLGWQPVLPAYPKIVLRGDSVHLVDLRALATAFAAEAPFDLGPDVGDSSRMTGGDLDPVANRVFLRLYDETTFPSALSAGSVALSKIDGNEGEAFLAPLSSLPKVDLVLFPKGVARAAPLVAVLHARRIAVRPVLMPQQDIFGFVQSGGDFGLERTFK